jgi:hypothetical protein
MGIVARQEGHFYEWRDHFFDLLRRISGIFNEKDRKNEPVSHRRSRSFHSPTDSWTLLTFGDRMQLKAGKNSEITAFGLKLSYNMRN